MFLESSGVLGHSKSHTPPPGEPTVADHTQDTMILLLRPSFCSICADLIDWVGDCMMLSFPEICSSHPPLKHILPSYPVTLFCRITTGLEVLVSSTVAFTSSQTRRSTSFPHMSVVCGIGEDLSPAHPRVTTPTSFL